LAALMTSFYSWRQFLMTFHGPYRGEHEKNPAHADKNAHAHDEPAGHDDHGHAITLSEVHESPLSMLLPLAVLAVGALVAGAVFANIFIGDDAHLFWRTSLGAIGGHNGMEVPLWVELGPLVATATGFVIAYYFYVRHPDLPPQLAARNGVIYRFLYNKWYFDEIYDFLFVRPAMALGRILWKIGDGTIIDGLGPDGISARVLDATRGAVRLQSGYIYHYALAMIVGVVVLTSWFWYWGGMR
jgi:NADH-quinone oxidoreductase subunit L